MTALAKMGTRCRRDDVRLIREYFESAIHYPTLRTVMEVENVLKKVGKPMKRAEIRRRMKNRVMHQSLNIILAYLLERGMIVSSSEGFVWIYNSGRKFRNFIKKRTVRVM